MAVEYINTRQVLREYGDSVVKEIRTRLRNNGKVSSGGLYDSIKLEVKETNTKFTISFHMLDYGRFVDKGVKGAESGKAGDGGTSPYAFKNKMPPAAAIEKWLKIKGIAKEASYPIRRHIFKFGITPTNFFTLPTTRRAEQLKRNVKQAMIADVEGIVKKEFGKKNRGKK